MKTDPKLAKAIATSLQLVLTLHEVSKAHRAAAVRWEYRRIYKIFVDHSEISGLWRWKLEKLAARYAIPIQITLNARVVDTDAPMTSLLAESLEQARAIHKSFVAGRAIAKEIDNAAAKRRFSKLIDQAEKLIEELEAYARQATDQGVGIWLSEMM